MSRTFHDREVAKAVAGDNFVEKKQIVENPTEEDVTNFLNLVEEEIQKRIQQQITDFGYVLYTGKMIEQLREELQAQPVYKVVYGVPDDNLPHESEIDSIVEETLFGKVSDVEFLRKLNKFMKESPLTKVGVARMMGISETHFGEVLRENRKLTKNFRRKVVKVLSKYGFK